MGRNLKALRSYEGCDKDMVMPGFCEEDLTGMKREVAMGVPWKDDLWSNKIQDLRFEERDEVRAVAIFEMEKDSDRVAEGFCLVE